MFKKYYISLSLCVAASMLTAAPFDSIVEDDVDVYVSLRSLADSREQWEAHPLSQTFNDPELQEFLQPLLDVEAEIEEESFTEILEREFDLSIEELFELFPGQMALACYNLPELVLDQADRPEIVLMAEFSGDDERLDELLQIQFDRNAEKQKERNPAVEHSMIEETFMGETLYFDETFNGEKTYIEDGYALVDGIFVLATPEARLRSAVEAIKEGAAAALSENASYLRSREQAGSGDLSIYINLEEILPPLNQVLISKSMQSGAAMLGLNAQSLNEALGLESMLAAYFDFELTEAGLNFYSGLIYREKTGIWSLMTYGDGPLPEAPYVPESVLSTSLATFDCSAMLTQLEKLLTVASPTMAPLLDIQLQNIRSNTGVDLRTTLLENFGPGLVSLAVLPEGVQGSMALLEPEQVFVMKLRDSEALSNGIEALKDLAPGSRELIESQEFSGETIYTIKAMPDPHNPEAPVSDVSYVITRSHLIINIGRVGLLQEVLTRMKSSGDGFWQQENIETIFEEIAQPGAVSRSYVDIEGMMLPLFQSMVEASRMSGDNLLRMESIPKNLSIPYVGITELNEHPDGFFGRSVLIQREAAE